MLGMDADTRELLPVFLLEMQEHLDGYESALLRLENGNAPNATLAELFRVLHTLKGGCALFGFRRLGNLLHHGETLAVNIRDGKIRVSPEVTDALLELGDVVQEGLSAIQRQGDEPAADYSLLSRRLEDLLLSPAPRAEAPALDVAFAPAASEQLPMSLEPEAVPIHAQALQPIADKSLVRPARLDPADSSRASLTEGLLHVDVPLLNRLLDRSSELMLLRHAFFAFRADLAPQRQRDYQLMCLRYQALAAELQDALMQVRMQPIGQIWRSYPRLLRELGQRLGKQIQLESTGEDTELDKSVLDAIRDPLMHLLRNAVDHGIELPEERRSRGKPPQGTIRLRAYQDEGYIFIEIADDGRGLSWETIRRKAIEKGLLNEIQAQQADQETLLRLLYHAGFSTAETVTDLSGRGVGMDVVHNNLSRIGGSLEVSTNPGQGTCFRMRLPLTLSLLPALLTLQGGQILAIPQHYIREIVPYHLAHRVEIGQGSYCRWREQMLPLGRLDRLLNQPETAAAYIVILQTGQSFALAVEQVLEISEVAIKPLGPHWSVHPLMAGATILGSGELALILSLGVLEEKICLERPEVSAPPPLPELAEGLDPQSALLLFRDNQQLLLALPLDEVLQLDDLQPGQVIQLPHGRIVSHRGELLPVLDVSLSPEASRQHAGSLVVCQRQDKRFGLLVEEIVDIAAQPPQVIGPAMRPGVLHTVALPWGAAEVLDPDYLWQKLKVMS